MTRPGADPTVGRPVESPDEPQGFPFTGNIGDPPSSAVPHSGGLNIAYGDGHAKFHRMEVAEGHSYIAYHAGDGIYQ